MRERVATPGTGLAVPLLALCVALLLGLVAVPQARGATCPNEVVRQQQGPAALALGDCRAYELVSPGSPTHIASDSTITSVTGKVAPSGNAAAYFARYPAEAAHVSSKTWLSRWSPSGWIVEPAEPQMIPTVSQLGRCEPGIAFAEDLSSTVMSAGLDLSEIPGTLGECGLPEAELVAGEPRGYANLYLRRKGGPFELVNILSESANATFQAASADMSRVVFTSRAALEPGEPAGQKLYVWADGVVRPVTVLPDGTHVTGLLAAGTESLSEEGGFSAGRATVNHAVSADGERIVFEFAGKLYLRDNAGQPPANSANCATAEAGKACTLHLDRSIGAGEDGGGVFLFASRKGDRIFFLSDHALTFPASALPNRPDLYEYDVTARKLRNLTAGGDEPANVRGFSGGSDDGSRIYFVARGVLTGTQENERGETAQAGEPNLYLAETGTLTYVATLAPWESGTGGSDWEMWWADRASALPGQSTLATAWSPSGRYFAFASYKALTGEDNVPAEPEPVACNQQLTCSELFLYDAVTGSLECVSCRPDGGKPVASTRPAPERRELERFGTGPRYAPRSVLDDGRVIFQTQAPLLQRDVNSAMDVYEYKDGEHHLISSGEAQGGSAFFDSSVDGSSIFFVTPSSLVGVDTDGGRPSLYVARVNGGFLEPPPPADPCSTEQSCRPGPGPQPLPGTSPVTATFSDPGNARPRFCKRNQVRRKGRCVNRKKRHDHKRRTKAPKRCGAKAKRGKQRGACTRGKARTNATARPARKGGR